MRRQVRIRTLMGWVVGVAILCALPLRFWLLLAAGAMPGLCLLAVIAAIDGVACLAFGPRTHGHGGLNRGLWAPIRLLDTRAISEGRGAGRGAVIAAATCAVLIGGAAFWNFLAFDLAALFTHPLIIAHPSVLGVFSLVWMELGESLRHADNWTYRGAGEAFSLPRWWLLYGGLTAGLAMASRADRPGAEVWGRLMRFAPWLVVIEIGHLFGGWVARGGIGLGPEPERMFGSVSGGVGSCFSDHAVRYWFLAGSPSVFLAALAYFRGVGGWRWGSASVGAVGVVPLGMLLSIAWCCPNTNPLLRWFPW